MAEDQSEAPKTRLRMWAIVPGLIVIAINAYMLFLAVADPPMSIPWR